MLGKSCGRTVSRDLAEFMCSSSTLTELSIGDGRNANLAFHQEFYEILASNAKSLKVLLLNRSLFVRIYFDITWPGKYSVW